MLVVVVEPVDEASEGLAGVVQLGEEGGANVGDELRAVGLSGGGAVMARRKKRKAVSPRPQNRRGSWRSTP